MKLFLPAITLSLAVLRFDVWAQDIEPRRWSHLPIGSNFAGAAYAYTEGEIFLDPVLRIEDGEFTLNTVAAKYTRSFEWLGKSARFDLTQAYHSGEWSGVLNGEPARVSRDGWGDTNLRFGVNLLGAPPLVGKEFAAYRARTEPETIVGAGLAVQFPTGEYMDDKLINLGNNRFNFRPQLGVVHNRGKWSVEMTVAAWLFTDNDTFFKGNQLEQDAVWTADAHLIYTFRPGLWASASVGYGLGGETTVNDRESGNELSNLAWGLALGVPINRALGLKFSYIGAHTYADTGLDSDTISCGLSVMW
jgi:Putative MetA-pathway of phenol degradation